MIGSILIIVGFLILLGFVIKQDCELADEKAINLAVMRDYEALHKNFIALQDKKVKKANKTSKKKKK